MSRKRALAARNKIQACEDAADRHDTEMAETFNRRVEAQAAAGDPAALALIAAFQPEPK